DFLAQGGLQVEPVTAEQAELALEAYQRYGKGRHRAGLNFGDCFAYALCKATSQPLLEGVSELWICSILCMYLRGAAWPPDHEVLWLRQSCTVITARGPILCAMARPRKASSATAAASAQSIAAPFSWTIPILATPNTSKNRWLIWRCMPAG